MNTNRNFAARLQGNGFNGANGMAAPALPTNKLGSFNRTITVKIVSATNADSTYTVFGYNELGADPTQGAGVTVTVTPTSHAQVARAVASQPFTLVSIKVKVTNSLQFDNTITYTKKDSFGGKTETQIITPNNYLEPENNQTTIVRISDIEADITGDVKFTGTIGAGYTMTWIMVLGSKVDLGYANFGESVVEKAVAPAPTGLQPQRLVVANASAQAVDVLA